MSSSKTSTSHKLWDVFKHPAPKGNQKWVVQFPKGWMTYTTKKDAEFVSNSMLKK